MQGDGVFYASTGLAIKVIGLVIVIDQDQFTEGSRSI